MLQDVAHWLSLKKWLWAHQLAPVQHVGFQHVQRELDCPIDMRQGISQNPKPTFTPTRGNGRTSSPQGSTWGPSARSAIAIALAADSRVPTLSRNTPLCPAPSSRMHSAAWLCTP